MIVQRNLSPIRHSTRCNWMKFDVKGLHKNLLHGCNLLKSCKVFRLYINDLNLIILVRWAPLIGFDSHSRQFVFSV